MNRDYYNNYFELERKHWWFLVRLQILEAELHKLAQMESLTPTTRKILNVGAATGKTSEMLTQFGEVVSLEYDRLCADFTRKELGIQIIEGSILDLPFDTNSFDWVCAFDVVEHIEDDTKAVSELLRVSKSKVCITVPAFKSLWSKHDEINQHFRRYTLPQLKKLVSSHLILRQTYFNTFLFPFIWFFRLINKFIPQKWFRKGAGSDLELGKYDGLGSRIAKKIFRQELFFLKKGYSFPFGVSLLLVVHKSK